MFRGSHAAASKPVNWKMNLFVLSLSQFLSMAAFNVSLPFFPLYLKAKEIVPAKDVQFWAGIYLAAAPVSLMIMSPIWGTLGDKFGRKMMLVRANVGGGIALYLMALTNGIGALLVLRLIQGAFTGTTPAAQTLVSAETPDDKQGTAMGLMMAAVSAGQSAGFFLGGILAEQYSPEFSFKVSGVLLISSALLALVAVRENFVRPVDPLPHPSESVRLRVRREATENFMHGLPMLLVIGFIAYIQTFDGPFYALFIDHLFRSDLAASGQTLSQQEIINRVYGLTGTIGLLSSIGAIIGSVIAGAVMDRNLPGWVWAAAGGLAGVGPLWIGLSPRLLSMSIGRPLFMLCMSGLASALVVMLARMTPRPKRGAALGWAVTIRSLGWIVAPLSGAAAAAALHWSGVFMLLTGLCLLQIPMFFYLKRYYPGAFRPGGDGDTALYRRMEHGK